MNGENIYLHFRREQEKLLAELIVPDQNYLENVGWNANPYPSIQTASASHNKELT